MAFATPWTGEDAPGDFIAIAAPDAAPEKFIDYARTSAGNPATLTAPVTPGSYELRYVLNGKKIDMPPIHRSGNVTFKKAPKQKAMPNQGKLDI